MPDADGRSSHRRRGEVVLLADDDTLSREFLAEALRLAGAEVVEARDGDEAVSLLDREPCDVVFTDLQMPGKSGLEVLEAAKAKDPDRPVVLVTAHGTLGVAIDALRRGADDILEKPCMIEDLELSLERMRARSKLRRENAFFRAQSVGSEMVVESAAMRRLLEVVHRVAPSEASVLIQGESGTGKERIAAEVHRASEEGRADGPFVRVNCAAIPENLMESEFFGHEAGAFTGADKRHAGCFEVADGGTLFLDEIAEMPLALQAKLLRALQEGEFTRVGGTRPISVSVRVVAATNRMLASEVAAGRFREDLYYRLNVVPVFVPPLRERPEEIIPLARAFTSRGTEMTADAERALVEHAWPGNVRELQNLVQRACLLCEDRVIDAGLIRPWLAADDEVRVGRESESGVLVPRPRADATESGRRISIRPGRKLRDVERECILATLDDCDGNRTRAAKLLGIGVRTLFNKLKQFDSPDASADDRSSARRASPSRAGSPPCR